MSEKNYGFKIHFNLFIQFQDTQELLSKRILEFSGFPFNKSSEEYYNRVMLLQT